MFTSLSESRTQRHSRLKLIGNEDLALLRAGLTGEHLVKGFRNTHFQSRLYARAPRDDAEARRHCAKTSRLIAKLRGPGLVAKVPRRRLYRVAPYGQRSMFATIAVHDQGPPLPTRAPRCLPAKRCSSVLCTSKVLADRANPAEEQRKSARALQEHFLAP